MPLTFLPLLALGTAAAEIACSWGVRDMGVKTCDNGQRIAKTFVDLDTCKGDCEADGDCVQIFWQSPEDRGKADPKCHRYRACTEERTQHKPGTNYILSCGVIPTMNTHESLQTALDETGCTSGIFTDDEPTDTLAWETLLGDDTQKNVQQVFEELFDTCYHSARGTATEAQQYQCCGEAPMTVHKSSIDKGGVVIHTCGPKAGMIPFANTMVDSNPPECKQLFNFPCEAFDYHERMARALLATGCPNRNPDTALMDTWIGKKTDTQLWGVLQDYCEVVQKEIGTDSLQRKAKDFCCGVGEECMPTHCTTQSSWDCGEPSCPIMKDTRITSATGIKTYIGETLLQCQELCQIQDSCNSWTWDSNTMCYLYSDTVSTSNTEHYDGRYAGYKCAKTYNCVEGQGKQGSAYALYEYNTEAECAAKCHEDSGSKRLGTFVKKSYSCVNGQGASGGSHGSNGANNRDLCANRCNTDSTCVGFDFTKNSQGDACRLYRSTSNARVDNAGSDNRQWCRIVTQPCVGFDFTEKDNMSNSCRLYTTASGARIGNEGSDERKWCSEHTGGFIPEAEYDCTAASNPGNAYFKSTETPLECARRCANDPACTAFDISHEDHVQNCRLMAYDLDNASLGPAQPTNRRFCRRLSWSERTNNFCVGIPEDDCESAKQCRWREETNECTMEDTIWCRNGRIGSSSNTDKSKWGSHYTSADVSNSRECWDHCHANPHCFAYEYKNGDCYLHDADNVLGTTSRYVYTPCPEDCDECPGGGFGCNDPMPDDDGWKFCRRIVSNDIDYLYSSAQQYWAPDRP